MLVGTLAALAIAESAVRRLAPRPDLGQLFYADSTYNEVKLGTPEGLARAAEMVEPVPGAPRFRMAFKPNSVAMVCYRGYEGHAGFDSHGCVEIRANSFGTREREELCAPKPAGQTRVLCVGDSTTVGWGVRAEDGWTRRAEAILRQSDDGMRLVNCGAAGALVTDEYAHALSTRFHRYEPDAVLVTLCLNDLLPINGGMSMFDPEIVAANAQPLPGFLRGSMFATKLYRALHDGDPLALDPARDWVGELLALPTDRYPDDVKPMGRIYWDSGVPQAALRQMRDWCRERKLPYGVALWPFLQGLSERSRHPFVAIHEQVAAFCKSEDIPFLDLLDAFIGLDPRTLWVTPFDMHGNTHAQVIATPRFAEFVGRLAKP